jgi:hypothetical protein
MIRRAFVSASVFSALHRMRSGETLVIRAGRRLRLAMLTRARF